MEAVANPHPDTHSHRLLVALAATSLLVNAVVIAAAVVLFASASARDWTAATLDLATRDDIDLRLSSVESSVADHESGLDAGCDWAKLQQANFEGTSLFNVFFDYAESVCQGG